MIFCLIILSKQQAQALAFARTIVEQGHALPLIFFHDEGVWASQNDAGQQWATLARQYAISLLLCSDSMNKRSIVESQLSQGFKIGSLAQLVEAEANCDHIINFKA